MSWFTLILVYFMVFIVVLLTALPWGVRPPDVPEAGHEPGAPERPLLMKKFIATALISLVITGGIYVIIDQNWISFRDSVEPFVKPGSGEGGGAGGAS